MKIKGETIIRVGIGLMSLLLCTGCRSALEAAEGDSFARLPAELHHLITRNVDNAIQAGELVRSFRATDKKKQLIFDQNIQGIIQAVAVRFKIPAWFAAYCIGTPQAIQHARSWLNDIKDATKKQDELNSALSYMVRFIETSPYVQKLFETLYGLGAKLDDQNKLGSYEAVLGDILVHEHGARQKTVELQDQQGTQRIYFTVLHPIAEDIIMAAGSTSTHYYIRAFDHTLKRVSYPDFKVPMISKGFDSVFYAIRQPSGNFVVLAHQATDIFTVKQQKAVCVVLTSSGERIKEFTFFKPVDSNDM